MTKEFTVSGMFTPRIAEIITQAVQASRLPEGINIVPDEQIAGAEKPFFVVSPGDITYEAAREAFEAGAYDSCAFDSDPVRLTNRLNRLSNRTYRVNLGE